MRRSAQTEGCIATLRRRYPATPGRALPYASVGDDAGIVPEPCGGGRPKRRAKTPALHCGREREVIRKRRPLLCPSAGRCEHRPLRRGAGCHSRHRCTYTLYCRAGVNARRGGLRHPGRVLARSCAAPLSRLTPTASLAGEPFGWKPFAKPPLQGEVDAPKGADGRVHCHLAVKMARQSLALCFVGDDLRAKSRHFVLCAPKRHLRAAVLASSRKPCGGGRPQAAGENARPTKPPRAGDDR